MISQCKIDIFVSGDINETISIVEQNENIQKLSDRESQYILNKIERKEKVEEIIKADNGAIGIVDVLNNVTSTITFFS